MPRPFWQVVEDPDYIDDWDDYMLYQEGRDHDVQDRPKPSAVKINGQEFELDIDKFFD